MGVSLPTAMYCYICIIVCYDTMGESFQDNSGF